MKKLTFVVISVVLAFSAKAQQELFKQANDVYQQDSFAQAIILYDSLVNQGKESVALYYNLGNAHFKSGNLAYSILNYYRALEIEPKDEEVLTNLKIAEEKTVDRFEIMPYPLVKMAYLNLIRFFKPDTWAWLALAFLVVLLIGTFLYLFTLYKRPGFILQISGILLGLSCWLLAYSHKTYLQNNKGGIVVSPSSYVKSGPSESAEDVFILHEGTKATVIENFEGWSKIRLQDGKLGWMLQEDIELI